MMRDEARRLRRLARWLATRLPASLPVRLQLCRKLNAYGDCSERSGVLRVRVRSTEPYHICEGTLLHEFAHAISWGMDDDEPHGEFFGEARRNCFDALIEYRRNNAGGG